MEKSSILGYFTPFFFRVFGAVRTPVRTAGDYGVSGDLRPLRFHARMKSVSCVYPPV